MHKIFSLGYILFLGLVYSWAMSSFHDVHEESICMLREQLLRSDTPELLLPQVLEMVARTARISGRDYIHHYGTFSQILEDYRSYLFTENNWIKHLITDLMFEQDVQAVKRILLLNSDPEFLTECLHLNYTGNAEINKFIYRRLAITDNSEASSSSSPKESSGPLVKVFGLSKEGGLRQLDNPIYTDLESGYFQIVDGIFMIIGIVEPALNHHSLYVASKYANNIDDFLEKIELSQQHKGMLLWYDQIKNEGILRRINEISDRSSPVIGIYEIDGGKADFYSQIEVSSIIMTSTLNGEQGISSSQMKFVPGNLVVFFPSEATRRLQQFELTSSLSEFEKVKHVALIEKNMDSGLKGIRSYVKDASLYAAYLY